MLQDTNPTVLLLITITALVSYKGITDAGFLNRFKFQVTHIVNGDKRRMLTAGFLHTNWVHLGFNMVALYLFGDIVINKLGNLPFLAVYFGSLLAGSFYSLYYHKKEPYYSAVGASGAVSGIVYSCILLYPEIELMLIFLPIPIPGYIFGVLYILYSVYGIKKQLGDIGHSAHLGGAIGGFTLTLMFVPEVFSSNQITTMILTIPILILVFFGKRLHL